MNILSATYLKSSPGYKDCPAGNRPEYAFIGRSNVGKSSLINALTGKKNLAKTSATPGKTQLINHFDVVSSAGGKKAAPFHWWLVDLPGYGYASVSRKARHNWDNMIGSYIKKRKNLHCLFVLIDSRHGPQEVDLAFINRLGEWKSHFVLVFTKTDKNKPGQAERNVELFLEALSKTWEEAPPYFLISAVKGWGIADILTYIEHLNHSFPED